MEDNLNGRLLIWKMTSMDTTLMEEDLNGGQPQWKTTSMEDNLNINQTWGKNISIEEYLIVSRRMEALQEADDIS